MLSRSISGTTVLLVAVAGWLALPGNARAASYTWQGPNNGLWSGPSAVVNWDPSSGIPGGNDSAVFSDSGAGQTVDLADQSVTIGSVTFNGNVSPGNTIASSGGGGLVFNGTSGTIVSVTGGSNTISAPVALGATSFTMNTMANSSLTLSGSVSTLGGDGSTTLLHKTGAGVLNISGPQIFNPGNLNPNTFRQIGVSAGVLNLVNANVYSTYFWTGDSGVDTAVTATNSTILLDGSDDYGWLNIGNGGIETASYAMHGGSLTVQNVGQIVLAPNGGPSSIMTIDNNASVNISSNSRIWMGDNGNNSAAIVLRSGTVNVDASSYIAVGIVNCFGVFNQLGGAVAAPRDTTTPFNGDPGGGLDLQYRMNKSQNFGIYNLNGGTLSVGAIVSGDGTSFLTNNNAYVNFHGGTLSPTADESNFIRTTLTGTAAAFAAPQLEVYSEGAVIDTAGHNITIGVPLLAPVGQGISGGTITIPLADQGSGYQGVPQIFVTSGSGDTTGVTATAIANLVDDGTGNGTFKIASITITNPGLNYTATPKLTISTTNATTQAVLPALSLAANVSGGLTKNGAGTLTLTASSNFGGLTTINGGALALASPMGQVALQQSTLDTSGAGTLDVTALTSGTLGGLQGPGNTVLAYNAPIDLSVGNNNSDTTFSGALVAGLLHLRKIGTGKLALTGSVAASGYNEIDSGTLEVDGSLTGSALNAYGNGQLAGNGHISLTSGDGMLYNSSAASTFAGTISASTQAAGLEVDSGTLTLSGANGLSGGTNVYGGMLILTSPSAIADGTSLMVGNFPSPAPIVGGQFVPAAGPAVTPVPEPGTLVLLAAGLGAGIAVQLRKRGRIGHSSVP